MESARTYEVAGRFDAVRAELRAMKKDMERASFVPDEIAEYYDALQNECLQLEHELISRGWPTSDEQEQERDAGEQAGKDAMW